MKKLQIFISSPGDVFEERALAQRVIERLQSEYVGRVVLEPVLWEHEPLLASGHFQEQIIPPSQTDVVISILWSRLGTRLPEGFRRPDGSRYDSGTEFEFEEALEGFRKNGKPDLLVYRKTAPPSVRLDDEKELMERLAQKKKLDDFIDKWFHDKAEGTLKAAFHAFESPSDFEAALEAHLHKLIERKLPKKAGRGEADAPAVWKKGSPFRGLAAFDFEHAPVFFGRTRAVSDILQALREQAAEGRPFVMVLGMSGGGKSSVVRAGVLPMLTKPGVIEGVGLWRRAIFKPTDVRNDLFLGLATALLREHALPSLDPDGNGPAELAQILKESPQAAVSLIRTALSQEAAKDLGKNADSKLALLVDQMEEMFTQDDILPKDRKAFIETIDALVRSGRVWVLATLRSDFYPRLADFPKLAALKEGSGQYDVMPPNATEIGQMIRLPTRAAGLSFEEDPASSERLDDMLRDAAVEHPEVLPLLQFTLEELYQRRTEDGMLTLAAYRELGGVEGSLAKRAETVFKDLPDHVEAALPQVLNMLVSIGADGHETIGRKRAPWSDASTPEARELLETFVANRLFVTELGDDGSAVVTVAHEALLWHWPRVKEWVAQNRENLRIRSRVATAAQRWVAEDMPTDLLLPPGKPLGEAETLLEQDIELHEDEADFIHASIAKAKSIQRLKAGIVAALVVLVVVAGVSAFMANTQRELAIEARNRAEIEAETAKQTTDFMVGLFEVSDPSEALGNTITAREIMDRGASRIETELVDQPEIQATLMETMGTVYTSLALYEQAATLLERALGLRRGLFGEHHEAVASTYNSLGKVLTRQAQYGPAAEALKKALAIRRTLEGDENRLDAAETIANLAEVEMRTGRFSEAEELLREALEIRQSILGEEDLEVAQSLERIGINHWEQGDYPAAESMLRQSIDMRKRLLDGVPNLQLADGLNNLGLVLMEKGDFAEARAMYEEALEMNRRLLEPFHPTIAVNLNNLALLNHDSGLLDEAEKMYRDVIEIRKKSLGEEHPEVVLGISNLAYLLHDKGEADAAIALQRDAVNIYRRLFPTGHPDLASSLGALGTWLTEGDKFEEAEPLLQESVEMRTTIYGVEHVQTAVGMTALAHLYLSTDRVEKAEQASATAHDVLAAQLGKDHWRTGWAASIRGSAAGRLDRFEEAEELLLGALGALKEGPGSGSRAPYVVYTMGYLAELYRAWGKPQQAAEYRTAMNRIR